MHYSKVVSLVLISMHCVPVPFCVFVVVCFLCFSVLMYELYNNNYYCYGGLGVFVR